MRIQSLFGALFLTLVAQPAWSILPALPVVVRHDAADLTGKPRPDGFVMQAATDIGDGASCVVGADATAPDRVIRAAVYRADTGTGVLQWNRSLQVPGDHSGSRATHCFVSGGSLYVIIQRDLTSPHEPVQTFLSIARLDVRTGELLASGHVNPPSIDHLVVDARISAWVKPGPGQIKLQAGVLSIWAEMLVLPDAGGKQPERPVKPVEIRLDAEHLMPV